ncbi:hypothetical protein T03_878 [Trichinella britovi]|uniref:Uncharacterized protein n=1 Tax=Trichinella britovi TaxID=45882 RepID=A0A0V1DHF1_TRIBR|nr:hypothetical protein T03_878 [Trichinella britovi]
MSCSHRKICEYKVVRIENQVTKDDNFQSLVHTTVLRATSLADRIARGFEPEKSGVPIVRQGRGQECKMARLSRLGFAVKTPR